MITNIEHFSLKRITYQDLVYSDTSVLDFSHTYQASFTPTFSTDDVGSQVNYALQLQYCLPNTNTWNQESGFILFVSHAKVSNQTVFTYFNLSDEPHKVNVNHRASGTRYRFVLTSQELLPSSTKYYSTCLFVPPVLDTMHETNWQVGIPYVYTNGSWHKAKSVFVYHNNNWTESIIE